LSENEGFTSQTPAASFRRIGLCDRGSFPQRASVQEGRKEAMPPLLRPLDPPVPPGLDSVLWEIKFPIIYHSVIEPSQEY